MIPAPDHITIFDRDQIFFRSDSPISDFCVILSGSQDFVLPIWQLVGKTLHTYLASWVGTMALIQQIQMGWMVFAQFPNTTFFDHKATHTTYDLFIKKIALSGASEPGDKCPPKFHILLIKFMCAHTVSKPALILHKRSEF